MDEADVYFVARNADPRDHRRPTSVLTAQPSGYVPAAAPGSSRVTYAAPATYAGPAMIAPSGAMYPQGYFANQQPSYLPPPTWGWGQPGTLGGLFGGLNGLNIGTLVDLVGQGFAAIRSLPTPPTASGDSTTDTANLILYQQALAQHGKTDEQIRTAVHVVGKLLGA
jgi:hypothetical protein